MTLFHEIQRRKVIQATFVYVVAAAVVVMIVRMLAAVFEGPAWMGQAALVLALVVLPFVIWLAWAYDLKPEGVELTGAEPAQSKLTLPWHRIALPVTTSVLLLTGSLAFFSLSTGTGLMSRDVVAVLPFRISGSPEIQYLRNGMMDLLSAELTGSPHAADPGSVLSAYGRVVIDLERQATLHEAEEVARAVGAGQVVIGSVVGTEARFTVHASLVSFIDGQTATATVETTGDSLKSAVDQLTAQLLAEQKKTR